MTIQYKATLTDPIFFGRAIIADIDGKSKSLSRLVSAKIIKGGDIELQTLNSLYLAKFVGLDSLDFITRCYRYLREQL